MVRDDTLPPVALPWSRDSVSAPCLLKLRNSSASPWVALRWERGFIFFLRTALQVQSPFTAWEFPEKQRATLLNAALINAMKRWLYLETLLWINRSEPRPMLFLRFGSRSTRRSCVCCGLAVASVWEDSRRGCDCSVDAGLQRVCSLWWFSVCSLHPRCGWSHASGTPAPGSAFASFFFYTECSSLSCIPCSHFLPVDSCRTNLVWQSPACRWL